MPTPDQELSNIDFESMLGGPLIAVVNAQAQAAESSVNFIKSVGFKAGTSEDPEATDTGEPIYVTFKYPKEVAPYQPPTSGIDTTITVDNGGSGYTSAPDVVISGGGGSGATATASLSSGAVSSVNVTAAGSGYTSLPAISFSGGEGSGAQATATLTSPTGEVPAKIQEMKLEVPILTMLPIPFIRIEETTIAFNAKINSMQYRQINTNLKIAGSLQVRQRWPGGSAKLNVSVSYQRNTTQGSKVERTYSMAVYIKAVQDEMPAGLERVLGILENAMREQPVAALDPVPA